jgi:hypothetical protein
MIQIKNEQSELPLSDSTDFGELPHLLKASQLLPNFDETESYPLSEQHIIEGGSPTTMNPKL